MARADITLPTIGLPITTEDPKVITALTALETSLNNIEAEQIASGAASEPRVFEAAQAWQSATLNATYFGAASLHYYKDVMGVVRVRGDSYTLSSGLTTLTTVATLPAGYRPAEIARGVVTQYGGTAQFSLTVVINTDGTIQTGNTMPTSGGPVVFSIQFRAA